MELTKQTIVIIGISVALLLLSEFFVFEKISESRLTQLQSVSEKSYSMGMQDGISEIYKQMENCQTVSISIDNKTKNLIDVTCVDILKKP